MDSTTEQASSSAQAQTTDSATTTGQASATSPVESTSPRRLTGTNIWACKGCKTHLALNNDVVSKKFVGKLGRAMLCKDVTNIRISEPISKRLMTGKYDISAVSCENCDTYLGWKYIGVPCVEQSFKLGHVLLEKARIEKHGEWV